MKRFQLYSRKCTLTFLLNCFLSQTLQADSFFFFWIATTNISGEEDENLAPHQHKLVVIHTHYYSCACLKTFMYKRPGSHPGTAAVAGSPKLSVAGRVFFSVRVICVTRWPSLNTPHTNRTTKTKNDYVRLNCVHTFKGPTAVHRTNL